MTKNYTRLDDRSPLKHGRHFWHHASLQTFAICLAAAVVAAFPAFHYQPWSLPTKYTLKETQQYVNFVIVAIALMTSGLLAHCLSITNAAEAQAEFESKTLSIGKLQARSAANGQHMWSMLKLATQNPRLWSISGPFVLAMISFSALSWVLSLVFVLESQLLPNATLTTANVTMGSDVPLQPDSCDSDITAAKCTYNLALSALTSQLITRTPYTFSNVTFSGPVGTEALPVGALSLFADQSVNSMFAQEQSQFCLPILRPDLVKCSQVRDDSRAKYVYVTSRYDTYLNISYDTYELIINPGSKYNQTYVLTSSNGDGGVTYTSHSEKPGDTGLTIVTGSGQYASLLSKLHTGQQIPFTKETYNQTHFTLLCDAPHDDTTYSWQWVDFNLAGGVMTARSTGQICRENESGKSPMGWLTSALELAMASASLRDGYSKLINADYLSTEGPDFERMKAFNMTPIEYILSHVIAIVLTAWTATNADIAPATTVQQRTFEHRYIVTVDIAGPSILALCVACIILMGMIWQAIRWIRAEMRIQAVRRGQSDPQWDLLDPLQLLAYGSAAGVSIEKLNLLQALQNSGAAKVYQGAILGTGPGTLMPEGALAYESRPTRSRQISSASYTDGSQDELPDWDEMQSIRYSQVSPGLRPLMLRPLSRSELFI